MDFVPIGAHDILVEGVPLVCVLTLFFEVG
jgi:hypothetical protein